MQRSFYDCEVVCEIPNAILSTLQLPEDSLEARLTASARFLILCFWGLLQKARSRWLRGLFLFAVTFFVAPPLFFVTLPFFC